jgi:hypothetical protein
MEIKMSPVSKTSQLENLVNIIAKHIDADEHHIFAIALWALHTHIYGKYRKSPRLAILSPVANCGKSTVLDVLDAMVWNPKKVIDPTVASVFRLVNEHTMLMDEADNMGLIKNMRSILNAGFEVGGSVVRTILGEVVSFPVYGPVALAAIGKLPHALMTRSVVINIQRSKKVMERFDPANYHLILQFYLWAQKVELDQNPKMPAQLIGRNADKWRPLIAIADSFGLGDKAREAALKFLAEDEKQDEKEAILRDTQKVFDELKTDKVSVDTMFNKLKEDVNGEYEIDYVEKKITKRKIGDTLRVFKITNKQERSKKTGAPTRYWLRSDFEEMWDRYA